MPSPESKVSNQQPNTDGEGSSAVPLDLVGDIGRAAKSAQEKGKLSEQLLQQTFLKAVAAADKLLLRQFSILSFVQPGKNPFAQENMINRLEIIRSPISQIRHVSWSQQQRLVLGIFPHGQGKHFLVVWLSMHPTNKGIKIYFGDDDISLELPEGAWLENNQESSEKLVMDLIKKGIQKLIELTSSIEIVTAHAYDYYRAVGSIRLPDLTEAQERGTHTKVANPTGFNLRV